MAPRTTQDERDRIVAAYHAGTTWEEIARTTGRTVVTVGNVLRREKVELRGQIFPARPQQCCEVCGRPVTRYVTPARLARGEGRFCSITCSGIARRADDSPAALLERLEMRSERKPNGCLEWTGPRKPDGYGVFGRINGKTYAVHRLAFTLLVRPIPPGLCVLHRCDNPPCWEPTHLFTGTKTVNNLDRDAKRRNFRRLTDDQVREIKARLTGKYGNQIAVAREFGVHPMTINTIATGKHWRHIN